MKRIILVRHAKSDWSEPGQADIERTLNPRGNRVAPKMARKIKEEGIVPDLVICSPAIRAQETCQFFVEQGLWPTPKIEGDVYEPTVSGMLKIIEELDDKFEDVAFFGHNPGFSYLAEYLTAESIGNLPTCAVIELQFEIDNWIEVSQGIGSIKSSHFPKSFDF